MCWQKFDPPLDPRTHLAIRFGSRNSHSMRFKRRPSSSQVTCGAKPLTNLDPDLGKVVPNACVGLQQIDPAYKAYLNQHLAVC